MASSATSLYRHGALDGRIEGTPAYLRTMGRKNWTQMESDQIAGTEYQNSHANPPQYRTARRGVPIIHRRFLISWAAVNETMSQVERSRKVEDKILESPPNADQLTMVQSTPPPKAHS